MLPHCLPCIDDSELACCAPPFSHLLYNKQGPTSPDDNFCIAAPALQVAQCALVVSTFNNELRLLWLKLVDT